MERNTHRVDTSPRPMPGLSEDDWDRLREDKSLGLKKRSKR